MAESIQFRVTEVSSSKVLTIEFGSKIRCNILVDSKPITDKPVIEIQNTIFSISEYKKAIIERETKGEISIEVGFYTRLEIENAKLLFHADEIPVAFDDPKHIEKAYQNLMDNFISKLPEYTSEGSENKLESFVVLLSIPFVQNEDDYSAIIQAHLSVLKNLGFMHITFLNQIASSFYSQKDKIQEEDLKENPIGILVNIGKTSQIGLMNTKILSQGFLELNLGTTTVLNHSLAILRDLNVLGLGQETIVQWLITEGRVDGKAPLTTKNVRRKEINITPILNTPRILFDYEAVTGMKNDPNSIIEGIKRSLTAAKIETLILDKMLQTIIITGPGAFFKGIDEKFKNDLNKLYPDKIINVIIGDDPLNSVTNGLVKYLSLWPNLKVFNLSEQPKEVVVESSVQNNVLQGVLANLKELKSYLGNLDEFSIKAREFYLSLDKLPAPIKSFVNVNINQESKIWAVEFNLFLNPLIKKAQISLQECDAVANEFRTIGLSVSRLPMFVKPILSKVFSSYIQGLKMIRSVHLETVNQEFVNILVDSSKEFQNLPEYTIDQLVESSKLNKSLILELLNDYLAKFPNVGFINNKFVYITLEKLQSLSSKLESVKERYFASFNPSATNAETKLVVIQIVKYYEFLIRGYEFLQERDQVAKCSKEKIEFESILTAKTTLLA